MGRSRREFLAQSSMGLIGAVMAGEAEVASAEQTPQTPATPGAPPAFGTAPPVGPEVSAATFVEAEKLVQVTMSAEHRAEAAGNWRQSMASVYERRTGPRKVEIEYGDEPATVWNPQLGFGRSLPSCRLDIVPEPNHELLTVGVPGSPTQHTSEEEIAFAPVTKLREWISTRQITSERLTKIYLERLKRFQPKLNCVITLTRGACAGAGACSRQGDCCGQISRSAARHSVGSEGPAGHSGYSDDVRRGALSQPRTREGCHGRRSG